MLVAQHLTVTIGQSTLLAGIDARFPAGRVTAIIGPNGAGKSTLLNCLAGLRQPDAGQVLLDEVPLGALSARSRAREIGYLPQDAPLHWNISVRALVALGRYSYGDAQGGEGREAIDLALRETQLMPFADRLAGTLSGGERARAMLARVLAGEPRCILADEPLAALDIAHRYALMAQFRAIAARGVGVVIVMHDLALAARFADDALLLDHGALVAIGDAGDVLTPERLAPVFGVDFAYAQMAEGPALVTVPRSG